MKPLTESDFEQLENSNRSIELIQRQYEFLVHGTAIRKEISAATLGNGIQRLTSSQITEAINNFIREKEHHTWMKFVPASGAASRMFAPFFTFQEAQSVAGFDFNSYCKSEEGHSIIKLFIINYSI